MQSLLYLLSPANPWYYLILTLILVWSLPWKGVALWRAAKNNHMVWFIVFLVLNLLAIPEIIYIFAFSRQKPGKKKRK